MSQARYVVLFAMVDSYTPRFTIPWEQQSIVRSAQKRGTASERVRQILPTFWHGHSDTGEQSISKLCFV